MKSTPVEQVEFIGGPEDGLVLSGDSLRLLQVAMEDKGAREVPMFVRLCEGEELQQGDELEVELVGHYVCDDFDMPRLTYQWIQ